MRRTTRLVNAFAWKPFAFGFGLILGGSVAYYRYHLDEVPLTHRRRFLNVSKTSEVRLGQAMFENILVTEKKNIVRENQALIEKILQRLSSTSDIPEFREIKWRVLVLNNPQPNAFVLPGGFCVVFTGIFPVCKNVDGLAVVLSHEAAHVLARHGAERLSKSFFMFPIIMLVSNVFGIPLQVVNAATTLLLELPNSRLAESEADEIGAVLMARSCIYNPREAVKLWERFGEDQQLEFVSTHPSNSRRASDLANMMTAMDNERKKYC